MNISFSWNQLILQMANALPLRFVHGARYTLKQGVCCIVHSHPAIEIVYHAVGSGLTRMPGAPSVSFGEGSVVIYAPEVRHDQVMDNSGEDWCVQLATPAQLGQTLHGCLVLPIVGDTTLLEDLRILSQGPVQISPERQVSYNLRATALLLSLLELARVSAAEKQLDPRARHVAQAEHYMRNRFATIQSVTEIANHCGVSPDHLRHCFQLLRRKSIIRFLTEVRIERARTLLVNYPAGLKQIATLCGFKDEYYFSAVFTRAAKMSPGRYRALHS